MDDDYLLQQGRSDTSTQELAEMLDRKFAESLQNKLLDFFGIFVGVVGVVRNGGRGKIGAVDRVVDRHCDLILGVVVDDRACDGSPHRLLKKLSIIEHH